MQIEKARKKKKKKKSNQESKSTKIQRPFIQNSLHSLIQIKKNRKMKKKKKVGLEEFCDSTIGFICLSTGEMKSAKERDEKNEND